MELWLPKYSNALQLLNEIARIQASYTSILIFVFQRLITTVGPYYSTVMVVCLMWLVCSAGLSERGTMVSIERSLLPIRVVKNYRHPLREQYN